MTGRDQSRPFDDREAEIGGAPYFTQRYDRQVLGAQNLAPLFELLEIDGV